MAHPPIPEFSKWEQNWNGREVWAKNNNIPAADFQQVLQADYKRLTNPNGYGTPMGDSEVFTTLSAMQRGYSPFRTPSDTPPTVFQNPAKAVYNNLQDIVTGLFHAPGVLINDFTQAIRGHPHPLFNTLANLIPGYTDITSLFSPSGRHYLASNPLSDILDFQGFGRLGDLAATGLAHAGMDGAAATLRAIPDHPIANAVRGYTLDAIAKSKYLSTRAENITNVLGQGGYLPSQKPILRGIAASQQQLYRARAYPRTPLLSPGESLQALFSKVAQSAPDETFSHMQSLVRNLSPEQIRNVESVMTNRHLTYPEANHTISEPIDTATYMTDPGFNGEAKQLMKALAESTSALQTSHIIAGDLHIVTHPTDGSTGVTPVDGRWDAYERRYTQLLEAFWKKEAIWANDQTRLDEAEAFLYRNSHRLPETVRQSLPGSSDYPLRGATRYLSDFFYYNREGFSRRYAASPRSQKAFLRRIDTLFGPGSVPGQGLFRKLQSELDTLAPSAERVSTLTKTLLARTRALPADFPAKQWMLDTLIAIRKYAGLSPNSNKSWLMILRGRIPRVTEDMNQARRTFRDHDANLQSTWNRYTQLEYQSMVNEHYFKLVREYYTSHYSTGEIAVTKDLRRNIERLTRFHPGGQVGELTPEIASNAFNAAEQLWDTSPDLRALIPDYEREEMINSAYMMIDEWKRQNLSPPIYVLPVSHEDVVRFQEHPQALMKLGQVSQLRHDPVTREQLPFGKAFRPTVAIPKDSIGLYHQAINDSLIYDFFLPKTIDPSTFAQMAMDEAESMGTRHITPDEAIAQYKDRHQYVEWSPTTMAELTPHARTESTALASTVYIRRYDLNLIDRSLRQINADIKGAYNKVMQVYRFGILNISPRYAMHLAAGGGLMTLLSMSHPVIDTIRFTRQSLNMAMHPDRSPLPVYISPHAGETDIHGRIVASPIESAQLLPGFKLGGLMQQGWIKQGLKPLEGWRRFLERIVLFQKSLLYLSGRARATPEEIAAVSDEAAQWQMDPTDLVGAKLATRALADTYTIPPLENSVLRFVFPFWGWTRTILRRTWQLPLEHPLRFAILNSLSMTAIGNNSSYPDFLMRLFFLGAPDKSGNQLVFDLRQWNPFRDVASYLTWGGVVASMNPFLSAAFESAYGIDSATGTPQLYPELTYDSFYGSQTPVEGESYPLAFLQQLSPQIATLMGVLSKNSVLRQEAYNDPSKLPYLIADSVGFPWIPYRLNLTQEQLHTQTDRYSIASAAVQRALQSNDMSALDGFSGYLPLPTPGGTFIAPKSYIAQIIAGAQSVNLPASQVFAPPSYASPYMPNYLGATVANAPTRAEEGPIAMATGLVS